MRNKKTIIEFKSKNDTGLVRIISDAAIATIDFGHGKIIPLVIIDTKTRPDIEELVRVHEHLQPGDVNFFWCEPDRPDHGVGLLLKFVRPMNLTMMLLFNLERHAGLVDQILTARALYIQPGQDGDRLIRTLDNKKILLDLPDNGFKKTWDRILLKQVTRQFREKGMRRGDAREAAQDFIAKWREFGETRMDRSVDHKL